MYKLLILLKIPSSKLQANFSGFNSKVYLCRLFNIFILMHVLKFLVFIQLHSFFHSPESYNFSHIHSGPIANISPINHLSSNLLPASEFAKYNKIVGVIYPGQSIQYNSATGDLTILSSNNI